MTPSVNTTTIHTITRQPTATSPVSPEPTQAEPQPPNPTSPPTIPSPTRYPTLSPVNTDPQLTGTPVTDDVPLASDDRMQTCVNGAISKNVIYNDIYYPDEPLKLYRVVPGEEGQNGNCTIQQGSDEIILYYPNFGYVGYDLCNYEACTVPITTGEMIVSEESCRNATIRIIEGLPDA